MYVYKYTAYKKNTDAQIAFLEFSSSISNEKLLILDSSMIMAIRNGH